MITVELALPICLLLGGLALLAAETDHTLVSCVLLGVMTAVATGPLIELAWLS